MYQNTLIWATANTNEEENVKATQENLLEKRLFIRDFTQSFSLNKDILNRFYLIKFEDGITTARRSLIKYLR